MNSSSPPPTKAASKEEMRLLWQMSALAFQFGTEIIAGVLLGWGFDALFGTRPWGVLIGTLAGITVGTADLVRRAIKINRQMDRINPIRSGSTSGGSPIASDPAADEAGHDDTDLLEAQFDEAMSHEQWKKAQDRKLGPTDGDDDNDDRNGPRNGP